MPNAEHGCEGEDDSLRPVFIDGVYRMYDEKKAWRLTAAISGAHTVGGASTDRSGYYGFWSNKESSG